MKKYKLIIFDIDGTIVKHISSWRYIHERLGLWNEFAHRYQKRFLAGEISYRKFCELDAACWKALPEKKIKEIFKRVPYAKNAASTISRLKKMGFKLAAISTGLQYIAGRIKKELKFDYIQCNELISKKGRLTGKVRINVTHAAKGRVLKKILKQMGVEPNRVISVGDSGGDIPIAKLTGYSIAFNSSDKELSAIADYNCKTTDFKEVFREIIAVSGR